MKHNWAMVALFVFFISWLPILEASEAYPLVATIRFTELDRKQNESLACSASAKLKTGAVTQSWADFDGDIGKSGKCGFGSSAGKAIEMSLRVSSVPWRLGVEKLFNANITWKVPATKDAKADERNVFFAESADIPFRIEAGDKEKEIVAQVSIKLDTQEVGKGFGNLILTSNIHHAEVLVDGSALGRLDENGEKTISNLLNGTHEVAVRNTSGSSVTRMVDVATSRTTLIDLSTEEPSKDNELLQVEYLGRNKQKQREFRRLRDGATVVQVPGGSFLMGNKAAEMEPLEHDVSVDTFLIDKEIVTFAQFKKYLGKVGGKLPPSSPYWGIHDDHPATFVTWEESKAYCEWVGGRLPTEAEREKAARGTDRRQYPWGNEEPTPELAVFRRSWGMQATEPIGKHPRGVSPYGVMDMGGQVWQFVSDWYDPKYFEKSPKVNPKGPRTGNARVVKGGSWDSRPTVLKASSRNFAYRGYREGDFGFRCAMDMDVLR